MAYYGPDADGAHMPFNFQLILLPWDARTIEAAVDHYELSLPAFGWPNWVLGNHDKPRVASRVGGAQARVAMMLLLTLRGTPTMYYGDEIAMCDVRIPQEMVQDPFELRDPGKGNGRDPQRTPMQWSSEAGAGFSSAVPWLPLAHDWQERNVEAQIADARSMLNFTRGLIQFRREEIALQIGDHVRQPLQDNAIAFERRRGSERILVVLNLSAEPVEVQLTDDISGVVLLSAQMKRIGEQVGNQITIDGNDGLIVRVQLPA